MKTASSVFLLAALLCGAFSSSVTAKTLRGRALDSASAPTLEVQFCGCTTQCAGADCAQVVDVEGDADCPRIEGFGVADGASCSLACDAANVLNVPVDSDVDGLDATFSDCTGTFDASAPDNCTNDNNDAAGEPMCTALAHDIYDNAFTCDIYTGQGWPLCCCNGLVLAVVTSGAMFGDGAVGSVRCVTDAMRDLDDGLFRAVNDADHGVSCRTNDAGVEPVAQSCGLVLDKWVCVDVPADGGLGRRMAEQKRGPTDDEEQIALDGVGPTTDVLPHRRLRRALLAVRRALFSWGWDSAVLCHGKQELDLSKCE